jgi:hypothetical protein
VYSLKRILIELLFFLIAVRVIEWLIKSLIPALIILAFLTFVYVVMFRT